MKKYKIAHFRDFVYMGKLFLYYGGSIVPSFNLSHSSEFDFEFEDAYSLKDLNEAIKKHSYMFEWEVTNEFYDSNTNVGLNGYKCFLKREYRAEYEPGMPDEPSEQQKKYFKNTVCKIGERLIPLYHGTAFKITSFLPEMTGKGNDQYGSGFYFTTSYMTAAGYMFDQLKNNSGKMNEKLGGESFYNVIEAYVNIENPIQINGSQPNLRCCEIHDTYKIEQIIRCLPSLYFTKEEEGYNILGDYFEEFWSLDLENMSRADFYPLIHKFVKAYYSETTIYNLDLLFKDYPEELRKALNRYLAYDGVIVNHKDEQHVVAWFPEQIKSIYNICPKKNRFINE